VERARVRELAELAEREQRLRSAESMADRMEGLGLNFVQARVQQGRTSHAFNASEVLHFIADLWH
jgi:hypothetical protein